MINVKVDKTRILPELIHPGTAGSYKERIMLHFSEEWSGLSCKIDFFPVRGKPISVVWDDEAKKKGVKIPAEAMEYSGIADYVVSGYVMDSDKIGEKLISVTGHMKIDATRGEANNAVNPEMPTPNVYEQLRSAMIRDINEALERAKESGEFDGEDGVSPEIMLIKKPDSIGGGISIIVRNADGTEFERTVYDGKDGKSPIISLIEHSITSGGGYTVKITDPDGTVKSARLYDGNDGITPHVGENENWFIGNFDTGVKASADKRGVLYTPQALTDSQKSTARGNINAAPPILAEAEGERIEVSDGADQPLTWASVFGKAWHGGVPDPYVIPPVPLQSLGMGGFLTLSVGENSMDAATPNGLPGIPVESGGNYVDGNGQEWISDEIDFGRGVYIKRIGHVAFGHGAEFSYNGMTQMFTASLDSFGAPRGKVLFNCLCNAFPATTVDPTFGNAPAPSIAVRGSMIMIRSFYPDNGAQLNAMFTEYYNNGTPAELLYVLDEPIETPLSHGKMTAFRSLSVGGNDCVITTDEGAWLAVKYAADTKSYVDKHGGSGGGISEETDPTVPAWAKQPEKPVYTAEEVGARADTWMPSASDVGALPADTKIPTKTSELTNDSGFITKLVKDLHYYYTKDQTYTQAEVNALVSAIPKFTISVVTTLPSVGISETTVYLLKSSDDSGDLYTEYIFANGAWEVLGSQRVDLTGYATETWVGTQLSKYLLETDLTTAVNLALANAKASGEFDGADGVSPDVSLVEHSITDGGGVSITVTKPDGTTSTARLYDGKDGDDGDPGVYVGSGTPPTGTRVQIDPDGEALEILTADETKAIIVEELAKRGQLKPELAQSIADMTDESLMYVLLDKTSPDYGYIFACMKIVTEGETTPNFTNLMDDPRSSIREKERYSHSGQGFKTEATDCSIIIPISAGTHIIRVRGAGNDAKYNNYVYCDLNNDGIFELSNDNWTRTVLDNGDIVIDYKVSLSSAGLATFAVAMGFDKDDLIVTVDEEITYTITEGGIAEVWANTGHAFVPADYEDRIIEVETKAEENSDKISELEDEIKKPKPTGIVTMFISPTGDDNNSGLTVNYPKKTVKACVEAGATRISAKRGTYNEEVSLSNIDTLEIFPTDNNYTNKDVHRYPPIVFDTSDTIAVSSLVTYNNIKSVAYSKQNTALEYVFTNGFYDTVHSTIHGYYAVLWVLTGNIKNDFKLKPVGTIAEVEATANSFTWANNVLYLNADLTNATEIRVPTSYNNEFTISTANKVKFTDIEFNFAGRYNLFIENCPVVEIDNCATKYSSNGSGFDLKSANGVLRNCYASRVHDGYGIGGCGHTVFIDCTAEWCFDDGMSHHTKCTGTVIGGRFEGNRKGGNVPAYGANVNIYGGLYKDNQMYGVAYITDSTHKPSTGIVQGAVIVGNDKGLLVNDTCSVTALNCHYVDNTVDKDNTGTLVEY